MRKLLAVCLMFFGTPIMAENITLLCKPKEGTLGLDKYVRFNDEKHTIRIVHEKSILNSSDYDLLEDDIVVHWSDKIIIFADKPYSPTNTSFLASLSILDRVKGRLQTVYASDDNFEEPSKRVYLYDCELYDREKPKF